MKKHFKIAVISVLLSTAITSADNFKLDQNGMYKGFACLPKFGSKLNNTSKKVFEKYTSNLENSIVAEKKIENGVEYSEENFGRIHRLMTNLMHGDKTQTFSDLLGEFLSDAKKFGTVRVLTEKDYNASRNTNTTFGYKLGLGLLNTAGSFLKTGINSITSLTSNTINPFATNLGMANSAKAASQFISDINFEENLKHLMSTAENKAKRILQLIFEECVEPVGNNVKVLIQSKIEQAKENLFSIMGSAKDSIFDKLSNFAMSFTSNKNVVQEIEGYVKDEFGFIEVFMINEEDQNSTVESINIENNKHVANVAKEIEGYVKDEFGFIEVFMINEEDQNSTVDSINFDEDGNPGIIIEEVEDFTLDSVNNEAKFEDHTLENLNIAKESIEKDNNPAQQFVMDENYLDRVIILNEENNLDRIIIMNENNSFDLIITMKDNENVDQVITKKKTNANQTIRHTIDNSLLSVGDSVTSGLDYITKSVQNSVSDITSSISSIAESIKDSIVGKEKQNQNLVKNVDLPQNNNSFFGSIKKSLKFW